MSLERVWCGSSPERTSRQRSSCGYIAGTSSACNRESFVR